MFRRLQRLYFLYFSRPAQDRRVYQAIHRGKAAKILEIGVGKGERTLKMLKFAAECVGPERTIEYTGIDLFEAREPQDSPGLALKEAHRLLSKKAAKVRLAPGDPFSALARTANGLGACDLIVISAGICQDSLSRAWFYVPRLLHANTQVLWEQKDTTTGKLAFRSMAHSEIESLAAPTRARRAA